MKDNTAGVPAVNPRQFPDSAHAGIQNPFQARPAFPDPLNAELAFWTLLATTVTPEAPAFSTEDVEASVPEAQGPPDNPHKRTEKATTTESPAATTGNIAPASTRETDSKDFDDLWTLPATNLSLADLRALQTLPLAIHQPPLSLQNFSPSLMEALPSTHYKSLTLSRGLQELLDLAYKTQRAVRVHVSDQAAVILRLARDGRVSAEFMPNDKTTELFLRQHLSELRTRLEDKQLPYDQLSVRSWNGRGQQQQSPPRDQ